MAQESSVEGTEEPNKNNDLEGWVEGDRDPLMAPHASNKDCAPTIARMDNAQLPNVQ